MYAAGVVDRLRRRWRAAPSPRCSLRLLALRRSSALVRRR